MFHNPDSNSNRRLVMVMWLVWFLCIDDPVFTFLVSMLMIAICFCELLVVFNIVEGFFDHCHSLSCDLLISDPYIVLDSELGSDGLNNLLLVSSSPQNSLPLTNSSMNHRS